MFLDMVGYSAMMAADEQAAEETIDFQADASIGCMTTRAILHSFSAKGSDPDELAARIATEVAAWSDANL